MIESSASSRWGDLKGVRPIRLAHRALADSLDADAAVQTLVAQHGVHVDIAKQMVDIARVALPFLREDARRACLYLSIPFCPSRCLYCSFPVEVLGKKSQLLHPYLDLLLIEADAAISLAAKHDLIIDTLYIGGGTPSVLDVELTELLMAELNRILKRYGQKEAIREFTFEAGRVETVSERKMRIWKSFGVDRISLNPQSFSAAVQITVDRVLSQDAWRQSFEIARRVGFATINSDLIVGLPGETVTSFERGVRELIALRPENITLHALALKRGSRLNEYLVRHHREQSASDAPPGRKGKRGSGAKLEWLPDQGEGEMFDRAEAILLGAGYRPYYLYRQMNIKGGLHNVGYALPGHENRYNVRIIEESHSILACGVGAVSKILLGDRGSRSVDERRVANFNSLEEYMARFDELIERKRAAFAGRTHETDASGAEPIASDVSEPVVHDSDARMTRRGSREEEFDERSIQ
ncbi:MAG: coproporphyrinogen dehydrogenase HemZ [Bacillota bacterium]|nr:coproporphyrinogen dehydrogenase HemZ [Bacillota bacterium]